MGTKASKHSENKAKRDFIDIIIAKWRGVKQAITAGSKSEDFVYAVGQGESLQKICIDSGATAHTFGNKNLLNNVRDTVNTDRVCTSATGHQLKQTQEGYLELTGWVRVYKGLQCNLISTSRLAKQGLYTLFTDKEAIIFRKDTMDIVAVGTLAADGLYYLDKNHAVTSTNVERYGNITDYIYSIRTAEQQNTKQQAELVHARTGHANARKIYKAFLNGNIKGLTETGITPKDLLTYLSTNGQCYACAQGKLRMRPHYKSFTDHYALEMVVSDVCGPFQTKTMRGERYFISFIDTRTRYSWIYYLRHKSDSCAALLAFCDDVRAETGKPDILQGMMIRSDNGGEYVSERFKHLCAERGIRGRTGDAYAPQTQGLCEKFNQDILGPTRTIFVMSGRPGKLWNYATRHCNQIRNILPTASRGMNLPPREALLGKPTALKDFPKVWGSLTFVHIAKPLRHSKLSPTGEPGYYVGDAIGKNAIYVYLPLRNRVVSTTSYRMIENDFSVVQRKQKWQHGDVGPVRARTAQTDGTAASATLPTSTTREAGSAAQNSENSAAEGGILGGSGGAAEHSENSLDLDLENDDAGETEPLDNSQSTANRQTDDSTGSGSSGSNTAAPPSQPPENKQQRVARERAEFAQRLARKFRGLVATHDEGDSTTATAGDTNTDTNIDSLLPQLREIVAKNTADLQLSDTGEYEQTRPLEGHDFTFEIPNGNDFTPTLHRTAAAAEATDTDSQTREEVGASDESSDSDSDTDSDTDKQTGPRRSARISAKAVTLAHEQEDEAARKALKDKIYKTIEQVLEKEKHVRVYNISDVIPVRGRGGRGRRRRDKIYRISDWLRARAKGRRDKDYFTVQADKVVEPKGFREAMDLPQQREWAGAILAELNSMEELNVWELEEPPPGTKPINAKWVFKLKRQKGGEIARFKARLCARGDQQRPGVDYFETYSATPAMQSLRIFFALANQLDLDMHQMDIKTAFLNGEFTDGEVVWMRPPPGIDAPPGKLCRLNKPIYGLKQAGRCWNKKLVQVLEEAELVELGYADCVFIHRDKDDPTRVTLLVVHVDDIITASNDPAYSSKLHAMLRERFPVDDVGEPDMVLGLEIERDREKGVLKLGQQRLIRDLLERFNMAECDPVATPMVEGCTLSAVPPPDAEEAAVMEDKPFRELVGGLNYLTTCSRADIALAVKEVARHCAKPTVAAWKAAKRILAYLKGTLDYKLVYRRQEGAEHALEAFVDADWGRCLKTRRSQTGYAVTFNGCLVAWHSKLQDTVASSTLVAELFASYHACTKIMELRHLLGEIGYLHDAPTVLHEDNQGVLNVCKNKAGVQRTKHVELKWFLLRELADQGYVAPVKVPSKENVADAFTKPLSRNKLKELILDRFYVTN